MKRATRIGFTLLELLVVIAILGILATMIYGNFLSSLTKGRDVRRKSDLSNIQKALELFYEDKKIYPTVLTFGQPLCETEDCQPGERIYMQAVPQDPKSDKTYFYLSDSAVYRVYACIENINDNGAGVNQSGYTSTDCGPCPDSATILCRYGVASSNALP